MKVLLVLLAACGGSAPVNIPEGAVLEFTAAGLDGRPPIDCIGRIYMSVRSAQFTCHDSRQTPPTTEVVDATVDYIQRPDEAWLHLLAIGDEKNHYPTYNGITMALSLRPNQDGDGWVGDALYYPRNAAFGFPDFLVKAHSL